mmetsp:Transcript_37585/g.55362  ORF Transcript_37585/g.55362 Transcript_37585/m.55362 type:complete len:103 (-) Transcript_37585:57-365(-)
MKKADDTLWYLLKVEDTFTCLGICNTSNSLAGTACVLAFISQKYTAIIFDAKPFFDKGVIFHVCYLFVTSYYELEEFKTQKCEWKVLFTTFLSQKCDAKQNK